MMNNKAIVEIFHTFGKGDGEHISDRFVINNTVEEREEIFDSFYYDEASSEEEEMINGNTNVFNFTIYGGDWDEPTGGYVEISKKEDLIKDIKDNANNQIKKVNKLFEGDNI